MGEFLGKLGSVLSIHLEKMNPEGENTELHPGQAVQDEPRGKMGEDIVLIDGLLALSPWACPFTLLFPPAVPTQS